MRADFKTIFLISQPKAYFIVGTQKNSLKDEYSYHIAKYLGHVNRKLVFAVFEQRVCI